MISADLQIGTEDVQHYGSEEHQCLYQKVDPQTEVQNRLIGEEGTAPALSVPVKQGDGASQKNQSQRQDQGVNSAEVVRSGIHHTEVVDINIVIETGRIVFSGITAMITVYLHHGLAFCRGSQDRVYHAVFLIDPLNGDDALRLENYFDGSVFISKVKMQIQRFHFWAENEKGTDQDC